MLALAALVALAPVATGFGDAGAFDSGREAVAPVVPADAHDAAVADADDAGADAFASGNAKASETKEPSPSFAVYRMLGNDMWPLQGVGQMRRNSVFAARHEAAPPPDVPVFWPEPSSASRRRRAKKVDVGAGGGENGLRGVAAVREPAAAGREVLVRE